MHKIYCQKLQREGEALDFAPYPGALGQRILQHICKEGWQQWLRHQTMLINEYRLSMVDTKAREFLASEMEKFLFGDGSALPPGYVENNK